MDDSSFPQLDRPLGDDDESLAALVALAGLPAISPRRLWSLLGLGPPTEVWQRVVEGRVPTSGRANDASRHWQTHAAAIRPAAVLGMHRDAGVRVVAFAGVDYPVRLAGDIDPPPVLFLQGDARPLDGVAVGIVGTRRCTRYGRDIAHELGAALAERGVDVVSGLAHGIDASAHAGAGAVDPNRLIGVVGSGLDIVYPRGNRDLWTQVAEDGQLVSEWPLKTPALPWRFPARNRIIAALSVAIVVVESGERGGSMHTVDEALRRDRPVFAVPGSIRSTASTGPHRLIADGAQILGSIERFVDSVAPATGQLRLDGSAVGSRHGGVGESDSWLLTWMGWEPTTADQVLAASGRSAHEVMLEIERQLAAGTIVRSGALIERVR